MGGKLDVSKVPVLRVLALPSVQQLILTRQCLDADAA